MSVSPDVARVLRDAADLLERDGWVQGMTGGSETGRCMGGAICDAEGGNDLYWEISELIFGRTSITEWNDAPGRTQAEVVAKLRELAGSAK